MGGFEGWSWEDVYAMSEYETSVGVPDRSHPLIYIAFRRKMFVCCGIGVQSLILSDMNAGLASSSPVSSAMKSESVTR